MRGALALLGTTLLLVVLGAIESWRHRRRLGSIRWRIHVNGTRGKSSVTRLIAAGLRQAGIRTVAKTTGTLPRLILPSGEEIALHRHGQPNIIEQLHVVAAAAALQADALVIECMALQPQLQWVCEASLLRATHAVVTNARPDHLEIMGPTEADVAAALAAVTPVRGVLVTAEQQHWQILQTAAADRQSKFVRLDGAQLRAVTANELKKFAYLEHAENVALALQVCACLGVDAPTALVGMQQCQPDPGALSQHHIEFFGRRILFINAFAANDPVSTAQIWRDALEKHRGLGRTLLIMNCRADRPDRSVQLGKEYASWPPADWVVLIGTGSYLFARAAVAAGVAATTLKFVDDARVEEVFENIVSLIEHAALVVGIGNIGGQGLALVDYFRNRATPREGTA